jgi:hypothetical protein
MEHYVYNINGKTKISKDMDFLNLTEFQLTELDKNSTLTFFTKNGEITILKVDNDTDNIMAKEFYNNPPKLDTSHEVMIRHYIKDNLKSKDIKLHSFEEIPSVLDTFSNIKKYHNKGIVDMGHRVFYKDEFSESYYLSEKKDFNYKEKRIYKNNKRVFITKNNGFESTLNNLLHSFHDQPAIIEPKADKTVVKKWFKNGSIYRENNKNIIEIYNEYNQLIYESKMLDIKSNVYNNFDLLENKKYNDYGELEELETCIQKNGNLLFISKKYDNNILIKETQSTRKDSLSIEDIPAEITYYKSGNKKSEKWMFNDLEFVPSDLKFSYIEYHNNGSIIKTRSINAEEDIPF